MTALARSGETLAAFGVHVAGLFEAEVSERPEYRLCIDWDGVIQETEDPYSFPPLLGELDVYLLAQGRHRRIAECLGAQPMTCDARCPVRRLGPERAPGVGDRGVQHLGRATASDAVAARLQRVGDLHSAPRRGRAIQVRDLADGRLTERADPLWRAAEPPPATASIVADAKPFSWSDAAWLGARAGRRDDAPLAIYEVHAPSWRRHADGRSFSWLELADTLVPYMCDLGFTHVELLPVMLHPFGGSCRRFSARRVVFPHSMA